MWLLITAMTLGVPPTPAPAPCCLRQPALVATTSVETSHRIGHFVSTAVLTTSAYGTARYFGADRKTARWIAVGFSFTAIFAKELYDYHTAAHNFSGGDVLIGTAGTLTGLWIAHVIHWPEDEKAK